MSPLKSPIQHFRIYIIIGSRQSAFQIRAQHMHRVTPSLSLLFPWILSRGQSFVTEGRGDPVISTQHLSPDSGTRRLITLTHQPHYSFPTSHSDFRLIPSSPLIHPFSICPHSNPHQQLGPPQSHHSLLPSIVRHCNFMSGNIYDIRFPTKFGSVICDVIRDGALVIYFSTSKLRTHNTGHHSLKNIK
jgi:hypothetical protein